MVMSNGQNPMQMMQQSIIDAKMNAQSQNDQNPMQMMQQPIIDAKMNAQRQNGSVQGIDSPWLQMQLQRQQNAPPAIPQQMEQRPLMVADASTAPSLSLWEMVQHAAQNDAQRKINETNKKPTETTGTSKGKEFSQGYNSASGSGGYKVFANPQQRGK